MNLLVTLTVLAHSEPEAIRTTEVLARASTGLALEGLYTTLEITKSEDDET